MKSGFYHSGDGYVCIFASGAEFSFRVLVPRGVLGTPRGREVIDAWAVGLPVIPGSGIHAQEIECLLDRLDDAFGSPQRARRSRFRLF